MNKFGVILRQTYFSRLKSKAFIISTIITLLFILGFANIQAIIGLFTGKDEVEEVLVIDETVAILPALEEGIYEQTENVQLIAHDDTLEAGKQAIEEEMYDALLVIELDDNELPKATYYENNATQSFLQFQIEQQLNEIKTMLATEQLGLDAEAMETVFAGVAFEKIALDETSKTDEELNQARGIVYVMLFVLYLAIIIYGQMIAMDVATEKSSRVMEILISSAPPVVHMFAKIIGIALLGLTQMLLFFVVGAGLIKSKMSEFSGEFFDVFGFTSTSTSIYIYALVFFILGYLLYATIAAMLGSLVSRVEDVQQLLMPMVLLIMVAFFIAIFGLGKPDATFITVTSFIPFFSPIIMFLRVSMLEIPLWEIFLSVGILVGTIVLLAILGARIYRGGVLMYGPSRSLRDFRQALRLTRKEK